MTENGSGSRIRVFDESGEWIGTTYPKRARGLVKKGRARWLADTPNDAEDPGREPDSIVLCREDGTEEYASNYQDYEEDTMNEFNHNCGSAENEERIKKMVEKFEAEMAKAREIAENAAEEARAAIETAGCEAEEAEENAESAESGDETGNSGAEEGKSFRETLNELGSKIGEAASAFCGEVREKAAQFAENETVRETADTLKGVGESVLRDAKKKLEEAEDQLKEARRTFEDARREAKTAEKEAARAKDAGEDYASQAWDHMKKSADEAGDAMKYAWKQVKKGWGVLIDATGDSFEWIKEGTKDAFRDIRENVKSMMNDVGDAGDPGECCCGGDEECGCRCRNNEELFGDSDESTLETAQAEAMRAASDIRAEAAKSARKSIEDEIDAERARVDEMLGLVKQKFDAGEITFEQYIAYTDKYADYLHDRLAELREELKEI